MAGSEDSIETPGENTQEELSRASRGDEGALERVVARWSPALEGYLRKRAPRAVLLRESAADLAQSVCREALVRMRDGELDYRGDQAFQGWLFGAADLKLKNRVRQLSALARAFDSTPPGGDLDGGELGADTGPSPSAAVASAEDIEAFRVALAGLDERQHECVRLFHFEGLSHAEIAARLDVTEGHSRTLLARALARLARLLRERGTHSA